MRKVLILLAAVSAVFAMTASLASGAAAPPKRCNTLYTLPCTPPVIVASSKVSCASSGTTLAFPISLSANAGLRRATVRFGTRTIKSKKYTGAPTTSHFTVHVSTRGLKSKLFTLTITATDVRGVSSTKSVHFSICKPKPVFTG